MMVFPGMFSVFAEDIPVPPAQKIRVGERLVYKITWLGIPVGTGELWVKEKTTLGGREVFHVTGLIETNKVLRKIFPMYDTAESWIDAETLESVQFEKNIDELREKSHERMVFDAPNKKGYFESFTTGEKKEFPITVPVHDVLSTIFWARRQPLTPGETVKTTLIADEVPWHLDVDVQEMEKVKVSGKKTATFRADLNTVSEGVERKGRSYINITTDASRTPVRLAYKAPFGTVVGTLQTDKSELHMRRDEVLKAKNYGELKKSAREDS